MPDEIQKSPQDQKSNFDFIADQANPTAPKKINKKIVVVFGLVVGLIIVAIIALLLAPSNRVQEAPASEEQVSQQQTVKDFIGLVNKDDNDGAYNMLVQDKPPLTKEEFVQAAVPFLKALKLNECTYKTVDASDATQQTRVVLSCNTIEGNTRIDQEFEISDSNPRTIVNYRYTKVLE